MHVLFFRGCDLKRIYAVICVCMCVCVCVCMCVFLSSCGVGSEGTYTHDGGCVSVVAVNFPAYDLARAVCGEENVRMLLPPGGDSHSYEPTARDILSIEQCDLFIYNGGESDAWVDRILSSLGREINTLKMTDCVDLIKVPGSDEYDEHVWTSPENAARIVRAVKDAVCALCGGNGELTELYGKNAEKYINDLEALSARFEALSEGSRGAKMIFGDRFPAIYFTDEYGIGYMAAFPGCAEQSEPRASDIEGIIDTVENEKIPVIFCIELSDRNIADSIADAVSSDIGFRPEVKTFYTCHNITKEQFDEGETYLSLMEANLKTLESFF